MARPEPKSFGHSLSFLRQLASGPTPHGANRPLVLQLEQLESRCLMNGDPAPVEALIPAAEEDADISALTPTRLMDMGSRLRLPPDAYESPPEGPVFGRIDELPDWLVAEADRRYGEQFGQESKDWQYYHWMPGIIVPFDAFGLTVRATDVVLNSDVDFSGTNTQVAGVDEADLVETDGEFLYMVVENELVIIDVRDAEAPSIASRVQLDSRPTGIYLSGDRLTLISENQSGGYVNPLGSGLFTGSVVTDVAWGGPYQYTPPKVEVQVLDVTDASSPQLVEQTEFDGHLVSSRMVEGQLRLVVQQSLSWSQLLPALKTYSVGYDETTQEHELRYETRNEYLGRVFQNWETHGLPGYRTVSLDGEVIEQHSAFDWDDLAGLGPSDYLSATTIATFDTLDANAGPDDSKTVFTGSAAEIYATEDSLYVFGNKLSQESRISWRVSNFTTQTSIWKFDFPGQGNSIKLSAEGIVDGRLTTQFAADEHDGHLRIVTTGRTWSSGQDLFVLEQVGKQLKVVGEINNIAPNENLHSVRFLGERAFVVTFRKVDPLFAIDLSDPANPHITGELKIPGFSDYLQPIDENHLLGVGRGADEQIGRFQEVQISIFDVEDMTDPQLAHRYSFGGGRSTDTEALWEHHAVSYFAEVGILAIPIYSQYQGMGIQFGVDNTAILGADESALQVFSVDTETGFEPIATIKHESRIVRSLRIGEHLVVVSQDYVTIHDLENPENEVAKLDLQIGTEARLVELSSYLDLNAITGIQSPSEPSSRQSTRSHRPSTREGYVPTPRHSHPGARANYVPSASARFAARDAAAERIRFGLQDEVAAELALELASDLLD